jgi:hypothetical protein
LFSKNHTVTQESPTKKVIPLDAFSIFALRTKLQNCLDEEMQGVEQRYLERVYTET